jgi:hypothetical protein
MKFLLKFANYDGGTSNILEADENCTVAELKQAIIRQWPQNYETCGGPESIRVVTMGRMLDDDKKTLVASGVAKMDYPTPLHIMLRPAAAKQAKPKPGALTSDFDLRKFSDLPHPCPYACS